mmetsp:Transcript_18030/g.25680  ORF Transcript_18030/g.25680 Transcript_18030/m.25680 type:complete len:108 (-) Transcript_18030:687-1010(-)|eukprot:CAMPEP_0172434652 /NCGR_PEP_ID=MMETSP1064-20121228/70747_1 /TAXON_ID=202472 /ORGANISM="Aulacoseira subarctica , Strain CCAP 1002/5" /LENGTH=107 /DNA_ID=CAMNT_0013182887 /DNA_START=110 /DNA_END=433 /DNA_ORIENTATION=+
MSSNSDAASSSVIEVEETLARISSHKGVEGILILSRDGIAIQSTLSEEQTKIHSALLSQLASKASSFVETLDQSDELTFLRIRSKNREVMIAPDKEYILIVIQNPDI